MLCNSLLQPHFDYACISWYPLLTQKLKNKIQTTQNKCIRFCLGLNPRQHIGPNEFKDINWLPTKSRVDQRIATNVFKYWQQTTPSYVNEIFVPSKNSYNTRSQMPLDIPLRKTETGQKNISFLGPYIWNKLNNDLKKVKTTISFTHTYKKLLFQNFE